MEYFGFPSASHDLYFFDGVAEYRAADPAKRVFLGGRLAKQGFRGRHNDPAKRKQVSIFEKAVPAAGKTVPLASGTSDANSKSGAVGFAANVLRDTLPSYITGELNRLLIKIGVGSNEEVSVSQQHLRKLLKEAMKKSTAATIIQRARRQDVDRRRQTLEQREAALAAQKKLGVEGLSFGSLKFLKEKAKWHSGATGRLFWLLGIKTLSRKSSKVLRTLMLTAHYGKQHFRSKAIGVIVVLSSLPNALALALNGGSHLGPVRLYRGAWIFTKLVDDELISVAQFYIAQMFRPLVWDSQSAGAMRFGTFLETILIGLAHALHVTLIAVGCF